MIMYPSQYDPYSHYGGGNNRGQYNNSNSNNNNVTKNETAHIQEAMLDLTIDQNNYHHHHESNHNTTHLQDRNSIDQSAPWQSPDDHAIRQNTVAMIKHVLLSQNRNPNRKWLQKLPSIAQLLENSLYKAANSFEEYSNTRTLSSRIKHAATRMVTGHLNRPGSGGVRTRPISSQISSNNTTSSTSNNAPSSSSCIDPKSVSQNRPQQYYTSSGGVKYSSSSAYDHEETMKQQQSQQHDRLSIPNHYGSNSNPINNNTTSNTNNNPYCAFVSQKKNTLDYPPSSTDRTFMPPKAIPPSIPQRQPYTNLPPPTPLTANTTKQQIQQVRRLTFQNRQKAYFDLLRHAIDCDEQDFHACPLNPECAKLKALWQHLATCNDNRCRVPKCTSSRLGIMKHFRQCREPKCPVCRAKREAMKDTKSVGV